MSAILPIAASAEMSTAPVITRIGLPSPAAVASGSGGSFSDILTSGLQGVQSKLSSADALVRRFALDDSVPLHQVTYALEEARLSVELAMQVRTRLIDGYRDVMAMQI